MIKINLKLETIHHIVTNIIIFTYLSKFSKLGLGILIYLHIKLFIIIYHIVKTYINNVEKENIFSKYINIFTNYCVDNSIYFKCIYIIMYIFQASKFCGYNILYHFLKRFKLYYKYIKMSSYLYYKTEFIMTRVIPLKYVKMILNC